MERDEAKHILELYRPGSEDDRQDPLIAEALALLETDAELTAWFEAQQAIDARIGHVYAQLEPPADLKASILAGMRAHAMHGGTDSNDSVRFTADEESSSSQDNRQETFATSALREPQGHDSAGRELDRTDKKASGVPTAGSTSPAWWRKQWVGVAAAVALLFVLFTAPRGHSPGSLDSANVPALQAGVPDMIQFLAQELSNFGDGRSFDMTSRQPEDLQAYLASGGFPSPSKLPQALEGNASIGCFTLDYNGAKMSMICFQYDQTVHLITVQKSDCPRSFQPKEPTTYEIKNQAFKAWTDGDLVYILSTKGSKEKLPEVI